MNSEMKTTFSCIVSCAALVITMVSAITNSTTPENAKQEVPHETIECGSYTGDEVVTLEMLSNTTPTDTKQTKTTYISYDVPDGNTDFKSYMSYRAITNKRSPQWRLQQECWTDEDGLRRQTDDYVVAMGTYYSSTVGERFKITLDSGEEFTVIVGDIKADRHTNATNQYNTVYNTRGEVISYNVLEFIVDTSVLDRTAKRSGTVSSLSYLSGNITSIKKIV